MRDNGFATVFFALAPTARHETDLLQLQFHNQCGQPTWRPGARSRGSIANICMYRVSVLQARENMKLWLCLHDMIEQQIYNDYKLVNKTRTVSVQR